MGAIWFACVWSWLVWQEPQTGPETTLADAGFRLAGARLVHRSEGAATERVREAAKLAKEAKRVQRTLGELAEQLQANQQMAAEARELDSQLNVQLAEARNVAANNQIVARLNVLNNERQKLFEMARQLESERTALQGELAELQDRFVQAVRGGQTQVAEILQAYERLASDPDCQRAVREIAPGKTVKTEPSASVQQNRRKLDEFAATIREEALAATVRGNTLFVPVRLGDSDEAFEMVVDSGASIVCIPAELAVKARLEIPADAPRLTLKIADGSEISARQVRLPAVRVGPFVAEQVEAAILGPEAASAPALLGMSFLGRFQFSIDLAQPALVLREVTDD